MESTFASRVRQFRQHKGLSQDAFAEQCDLKQGNIAHMENGTEPKQSNVSKLTAGFPDLNPDWLLNGIGPMLRDGRTLTAVPVDNDTTPAHFEEAEKGKAIMKVVPESEELKQVKSERDFLRGQNTILLDIVKSNASASAQQLREGGKAEASADAATLYETTDQIAREFLAPAELPDFQRFVPRRVQRNPVGFHLSVA